ncbi:MBL fold metallo-hydrolase [Roseomonas elaeocarpi]|uniref:MBL fold metallo-hydrolase n=1 Tax=Roseomonas elaeocarpi TaxID=907779 RepID=A0ABV6JSW3_9PROT
MTPDPSNGAHAYTVGRYRVTVVSDGHNTAPLAPDFVRNAPTEAVQAALARAGWPTDTLTTSYAPILIEGDGRLALIDTGVGPDAGSAPGSTRGRLLANLAALGVSHEDVDTVVISHFHGDHVGGLVSHGAPVFPRASVHVPEPEWHFWMSDEERTAAPSGRMRNLFDSNRAIFAALPAPHPFRWGDEVIPGLRAVGTPGHSIGHTSFDLVSGGQRVFVQGDLTNHAALFLPHPDWFAGFDQDGPQAVRSRLEWYRRLAAERVAVQAFHHPFPGLSYLEAEGDGFRRVPIEGV